MTTVFSKIIRRELPAYFVHADEHCVAFLTIAPITAGHTLVVPRLEIDQWTDLEPALLTHLTEVSARIGNAVKKAFTAPRAGMLVAGFEVPHAHLHVFPARGLEDMDLARADPNVPAAELAAARDAIVAELGTEPVLDRIVTD
jgi:histidine triad (HIT) family protein